MRRASAWWARCFGAKGCPKHLRWVVVAILAAAVGIVWWRVGPKPGESLFADWTPKAQGKVWTIAGDPDSSSYVFVDPSGAYQPRRDSYSIHFYLYDRDKSRLCTPPIQRCISDDDRVTPFVIWRGVGTVRGPVVYGPPYNSCESEVCIKNPTHSTRRFSLFVAAVPYQITGAMRGCPDVRYDTRTRSVLVGDRVLFSCGAQPSRFAVYGAGTDDRTADITGYVRMGTLPNTNVARGGPRKITSAAVRFDFTLPPDCESVEVFSSPIVPVGLTQWDKMRTLGHGNWCRGSRLDRVKLQLPDRECERCFRASVGYLTLLAQNGKPVPGPARYRAFWVRDCAYMTDALYYSGQQDLIPPALDTIRSMQLPSGGFPPKLGAKSDDELDAPGEAIYALVQHYRRTGDTKWLGQQWPCIKAACAYIRAKRARGIMPASVSAEDLGDKLRQHYWDDFWCTRGLRDGAYAARALGKSRDAEWIAAEAESLLNATRASIRQTMARHSIGYIPNGPDEVVSSAMARGTSCALWPCMALDPAAPLVRASFDTYWRKWIEPSAGGFVHKGHYWPYAGLDLAQGYLMLGQRERAWTILDWTLAHDPTGGFYAWPEAMSKRDLTLAEGDMPHGWMCAAYVSLVRNMLVREAPSILRQAQDAQGRASSGCADLLLLSGVPRHWLKPGSVIEIKGFPTEFGRVSYRAEVTGDVLRLSISGARPHGSYRVCLPGREVIVLPGKTRSARIRLKPTR